MQIQVVGTDTVTNVIESRQPLGLFLCCEDRCWVAVDNSDGDAWTEEFHWKLQAIQWLRGKFEVSQ